MSFEQGMPVGLAPNDNQSHVAGSDRLSESYSFECSEYFHLADLSPICSLVYGLAYKLTKGGDNPFFASANSVASYFGRSASQVRRGLKQLEAYGLLELRSAKSFRTNSYRVVSHREWASQHPGRCCEKLEFSYTDEGDPLGRQMWQITGGRVKFQPFNSVYIRKLGFTDNEIIEAFSSFWNEKGHKLDEREVSPHFYMALASTKEKRLKEAPIPLTG